MSANSIAIFFETKDEWCIEASNSAAARQSILSDSASLLWDTNIVGNQPDTCRPRSNTLEAVDSHLCVCVYSGRAQGPMIIQSKFDVVLPTNRQQQQQPDQYLLAMAIATGRNWTICLLLDVHFLHAATRIQTPPEIDSE